MLTHHLIAGACYNFRPGVFFWVFFLSSWIRWSLFYYKYSALVTHPRLPFKPTNMFNVTFFSGDGCGPRPDQPGEGEDFDAWEVATAAAVPSSVLLVVVVLVLVPQHLESVRGLIESINQLITSLSRCLPMHADAADEQVEMEAVVVQPSARRCPHNLSD